MTLCRSKESKTGLHSFSDYAPQTDNWDYAPTCILCGYQDRDRWVYTEGGNSDWRKGASERDEGMNRVEKNNDEFVQVARDVAEDLARRNGMVCADQTREITEAYGIFPNHHNAWGPVFRGHPGLKAAPAGWKYSERPANHRSKQMWWVLRDHEDES